jgi:hypothetical protein
MKKIFDLFIWTCLLTNHLIKVNSDEISVQKLKETLAISAKNNSLYDYNQKLGKFKDSCLSLW